jgi:hypothetical protein
MQISVASVAAAKIIRLNNMNIRIRDWDLHFERDRSKQWKHISWVPIPNKQGEGYRRIMREKNGPQIFGCWIALIEQASLCEPRGDLSKHDLIGLSLLTLINETILKQSIKYLSEVLDWIEIIQNLDNNVNDIDKCALQSPSDSSMLCNSIQSNAVYINGGCGGWKKDFSKYQSECDDAYNMLIADSEWVAEQQKYNSNLNILLSIEKAWRQFWRTEEGWKNKKSSKTKDINWKTTFTKALSMKINWVWKDKNSNTTSFKNKAEPGKYDEIDRNGKS